MPAVQLISGWEIADTDGFSFDESAVFGLVAGYPHQTAVPYLSWSRDDVAGCIDAKQHDDALTAAMWRAVADLSAGCARLAFDMPTDLTRQLSKRVFFVAWNLADALPWPLPKVPASAAGPPVPELAAVASMLHQALIDPSWTDPDALSGWVNDAVTAILAYRVAADSSYRWAG